ncbi:MAG: hypothetical protein P4L64_07870 [Caulobacteraceae bacterium]|nr:hypothetical protein [Caulobacteraceae bacterium]
MGAKRPMIAKLVLAFIFAALPFQYCVGAQPTVSLNDVEEIEQVVALPAGAHPVSDYSRYYDNEMIGGRVFIRGVFVLEGPSRAGRHLSESAMPPTDGGCWVVTIFFDLKNRRVAGVYCNGLG